MIMKTLLYFIRNISLPVLLIVTGLCSNVYSLKSNPAYITPSDKYHIVRKGDTLYNISQKYDIPVDQLKLYNNLEDDTIILGQKIYFTPSTPTKSEYVTVRPIPQSGYHLVEKGETVYRISKMYNLEIMDLMQYNNLESFDIMAGQKIWLNKEKSPVTPPDSEVVSEEDTAIEPTPIPQDDKDFHIVAKGENLYRISLKYGMTVVQLKKLNNLTNDNIEVGQRLAIVPGKAKEVAQTKPVQKRTAEPAVQIRKDIHLPLKGKILSEFGLRNGTLHNGIDIGASVGEPIYAALDGKVVFVGTQRGYGNVVLLEHANFIITVYAHNERNLVRLGDSVKKGQPIATVGQTGNATTPHLHFEYRVKGKAINPRNVIGSF